ncbi:MAG TPA: class I SAM-dependent methyltransferase [Gaiellaceae bacterium]|nr:class I SAM-dependent methyltransferase [Gaiellaceae bacterium]
MSLSEEARRNREVWTRSNAEYTDASAAATWAQEEITWGMFAVPEAELNVLGDVAGKDVLELGCGTAYFSAWLAKRGARPVGLDVTPAQLETARRLQRDTGLEFPLIEADAADVPLPAASFDLVLSEYGASIWVDPYRWIPEAARLLRRGGALVFLRNSTLAMLCTGDGPDDVVGETLVRPQFGMHRFDQWDGVEYHLAHGDWIALLRDNGFEIEALHELQAPPAADDHTYYMFVSAEWAKRWPAEEIWKARKTA